MGGNRKKKSKNISPAISPTLTESNTTSHDELMDDLFAALEQRDQSEVVQAKSPLSQAHEVIDEVTERRPKKDSRTRHKEREMRKIATRLVQHGPEDEAAALRITQETEEEKKAIFAICQAENLEIKEITPDGHCLFTAIADQLALLSIIPPETATYQTTRAAAAKYILEHPNDFLPFLVALHNEDGHNGASHALMSMEDLQKYCATIKNTGVWGGEPEILALAKAYNVPIHVIQCGKPSVIVHLPGDPDTSINHILRISYHRRMYGLGEHYNSLRPKRP